MDAATRRALEAIDRAVAEAGRLQQTGPVFLSAEYRAAVGAVESLAQNQSGADKTWVERARESFRAHFAAARRR
jgi:alkylhydroperoxidase family enzyme